MVCGICWRSSLQDQTLEGGRLARYSTIRFYRNGCALYIFDFAHDLIRKPLTLFGIMR
jgi:hypothetical protein